MNPAPSLIFFSVLSGAGFGFLAFLGAGFPLVAGWSGFWAYFIGYALAVSGLLFSTFHLGQPKRALKAFSQWRTSWLSREAWLAVLALLVSAVPAVMQIWFDMAFPIFGLIATLLCLLTVFATSMIYTQMKSVPRWHNWTVPLHFFTTSLAGGAILSTAFSRANQLLTIALLLLAGVALLLHWVLGDRAFKKAGQTLAKATGLEGEVRAMAPPHTGENYLLKEMVYEIARRHSYKLRVISLFAGIGMPIVITALGWHPLLSLNTMILHLAGMIAARWLFFAEAEHVVGLYYGKR